MMVFGVGVVVVVVAVLVVVEAAFGVPEVEEFGGAEDDVDL